MNYLVKSVMIEYGQEAYEEVVSVLRVVRNKIVNKNLFGWREFVNDTLADVVRYMIETEFQYSGGAYVAIGMQIAIDACRKCNALKRRGNYETISIYLVENEIEDSSKDRRTAELLSEIENMLGKEVAEHLEKFLKGKIKKISPTIAKQCRTDEFKELLRFYSKNT